MDLRYIVHGELVYFEGLIEEQTAAHTWWRRANNEGTHEPEPAHLGARIGAL